MSETTTPTPTLTPEQIDGLEGRELDAAIAIHLFGWRFDRRSDGLVRVYAPGKSGDDYTAGYWESAFPKEPNKNREFFRHYSTDPAAADLVRVWLEGKGLTYREDSQPRIECPEPRQWQCFVPDPEPIGVFGSSLVSPFVARCRAALKAAMSLAGEKEEGKEK